MLLVFLICGGVALLLIIVFVVLYNSLVKARNLAQTALSDIDVHLTKRFSLVPNLVAITKNYAQYESGLLLEIVEKRSGPAAIENVEQVATTDDSVTSSLHKLQIVAENYPELKANQQFLELMENLSFIENDLVFSRRFFNGSVRDLNNRIQSFPNSIIAVVFGFQTLPFYRVSSEFERAVPITDMLSR